MPFSGGRSGLEYLFDKRPAPGVRQPVLPGLWWVCMPLPFALDHVNCWWLEGEGERCLIDTGVNSAATLTLWQRLLDGTGAPDTLLCTHYHPDHTGLARWFAERGSALIGSAVEIDMSRRLWALPAASYAAQFADWYQHNGVDADAVLQVSRAGNGYRRIVAQPPAEWQTLGAGDSLRLGGRDFTVMFGRGHAPAMLMLYAPADRLLIAADQVLPGISPNVSLMPLTTDDNPLASFLDTVEALRALPEDTVVLPSHGRPFRGLHARLDALASLHGDRLADVLAACGREPHTAVDLFDLLFNRALDAQQLSFALGESLSHLRYLERRGCVHAIDDGALVKYAIGRGPEEPGAQRC